MKIIILFISIFMFISTAIASDFGFNNLNQQDVDDIFEEFSATFTHSTITGAKSKSKVFGFEAGLVAGVTDSEQVKDLVASAMPANADDINYLPFASLYALVSLPLGITAEANFMPKIDFEDVEFKHLSLAAKVELSYFFAWPVEVAIRGMLINTSASIEQSNDSFGTFTGRVEYEQTQLGLQAVVGKSFGIIEPYASIGILSADGELVASGTGTIFNFTASDRVDSSATSLQFAAGLQVNLLLVKLGAEYVNSFGANHLNAKLSLSF